MRKRRVSWAWFRYAILGLFALGTLLMVWVALTTGGPVNPDHGDPGGPEYLPHWPPTITMCSVLAHEGQTCAHEMPHGAGPRL